MVIDIQYLKKYIYAVVGAIYEVHRELGPGLNEYCYQEGLELELKERNIEYNREYSFHPFYHGVEMAAEYRLDFLCKEKIIIECKAVTELTNTHRAQLYNYMRLLRKPCGILVNFSDKKVEIERYFYDIESKDIISVDGNIIYHRTR
jgi:GxxExxY protein